MNVEVPDAEGQAYSASISMWDWDVYAPGATDATDSGTSDTAERAAAHVLVAFTHLGVGARATLRHRTFEGIDWEPEKTAVPFAEVTSDGIVWHRNPEHLR